MESIISFKNVFLQFESTSRGLFQNKDGRQRVQIHVTVNITFISLPFPAFFVQHTHYPQYAGPGAAGRTLRGPFGDALLELDNTIGQLMITLEKTGVIGNTLVLFTSDNGLVFFLSPLHASSGTAIYSVTFFVLYQTPCYSRLCVVGLN